MANTIDSLQIEITASSDEATRKINQLTRALEGMKSAVNTSGVGSFTNILKNIGSTASETGRKLSSLFSQIEKITEAARNMNGINLKQIVSDSGGSFRGWDAERLMNMGQYEQLDRRLGILMSKMEEAAARGNDLQALNLARQANSVQAQLNAIEDSANQAASRFDTLRESIKSVSDSSLVRGLKHLESAVKRIILYRAIRSGIKYITDGFREGLQNAYAFSKAVGGDLAETLDRLSSSGATLKNQLGSAFGGLIQAAAPVLLRIIELATSAADAISQLMAALGGKSFYKRATAQADQYGKAAGAAAGAAKELNRQIMGFDEINKLNDITGGGGGGGNALDDITDAFDFAEISDFWKRVSDLFSSLKLSIKDVFFDWKDLNPEQIAEKAIVGICGLLGGVTGFLLGGVPGAIVGTITGVAFGLLIDSLTFNHDGVLSSGEIAEMISGALFGLAGGVIGFFAGGPAGAFIGASVGIGLYATLEGIDFLSGGKMSAIVDQLATALTILTGAMIGFSVGGPAGALIGAAIGLGVAATIEAITFDVKQSPERAKYASGLDWFVCGVLGLPTDEELKTWGRNVVTWVGEGLSDFGTELYYLFVQPFEDIVGKLHTAWDKLETWWSTRVLPQWHITLPHLSVLWEPLGGDSIISRLFGFTAIPHFNIDWYAKGGVIDFPSLIGVGEAGAEAIVPLERNTQWISAVATEMNRQQYNNQNNAGGFSESLADNLEESVYMGFMRAIMESGSYNNSGNDKPVVIYLDGREIARSTTKHQRQMARANCS